MLKSSRLTTRNVVAVAVVAENTTKKEPAKLEQQLKLNNKLNSRVIKQLQL